MNFTKNARTKLSLVVLSLIALAGYSLAVAPQQNVSGGGSTSFRRTHQAVKHLPIASGVVVRLVCTPSATTPFTWIGNFGGYER